MGAKKLENAAAAAGFAMVNPDDFGADRNIEFQPQQADKGTTGETEHTAASPVRSWLTWDYTRLMGTKAPA